jgi:hypothetical protein
MSIPTSIPTTQLNIESVSIVKNDAIAKIWINNDGELWLELKTPDGQMAWNLKGNLKHKQFMEGVGKKVWRGFFERIK